MSTAAQTSCPRLLIKIDTYDIVYQLGLDKITLFHNHNVMLLYVGLSLFLNFELDVFLLILWQHKHNEVHVRLLYQENITAELSNDSTRKLKMTQCFLLRPAKLL